MQEEKQTHQKYFFNLAAAVVVLIGTTFVINYCVDPLWYGKGNVVTGHNYVFNERFAKANRYAKTHEQYDCIVFGSSRVTLLQVADINGFDCFNFSFSAGRPDEFLHYANYVKSIAREPRLVIVGVDARDFWRAPRKPDTPDFVLQQQTPPSVVTTYLSLDSLDFSIRTLFRSSPYPRYYRDDFACDILHDAPTYRPKRCVPVKPETRGYEHSMQQYYQRLRKIWPNATYVGYTPMISPWHTAPLYFDGTLSSYFDVMYSVATIFDRFYDLSIPSAASADTSQTYDGEHYSLAIQERIAELLLTGKSDFGIALHQISQRKYESVYRDELRRFIQNNDIEPAKPEHCLGEVAAR